MNKQNLDRRRFLTGSMGAIGGSALALALTSGPLAQFAFADHELTDIELLNYALTLEHLEYAFYRDGLANFRVRDFMRSNSLRGLGREIRSTAYDRLIDIRDHEGAHVDTLTSVIESLGGDPVSECTYDFGYSDLDSFLAVAQALENTGVMAYDGAIGRFDDYGLATAGATIATVEARHAAYLNLLNGDSPFPAAFDEAKTRDEILAIAGPFIVSCP